MASLSLEHVCKKYPNGFEAVKDFNLEIADKEFIIFVGPSGCGKSTTLRMVAGLEEISSGTLKIDGRVVNDVEPKDRDIAMVFQSYALYPHMTVYDNMAFSLKLRKTPKDQIDKMVREAAKILDLEKLLDRKPKALSGGQRQRVAMGRAIVRNPKVFLMDEPLSNLDAKLRVQMRTEISKLHQRLGATIIYVTHDKPANLFTAGFIGSPQMNFLDAKVTSDCALDLGQAGIVKLPTEKASKLKGYVGKTVVMGIRPEHLNDDPEVIAKSTATLDATIEVYELLGAEVFLYFTINGANMTARVNPKTEARNGSKVKFAIDVDKIHIFDKETEKTITN